MAVFAFLFAGAAAAQVATEISLGSGAPRGITAGPDGDVWFGVDAVDAIGRVTPGGVVTLFTARITNPAFPESIVLGPDGNLWFSEESGRIGRITPTGVVTEFTAGITPGSSPAGITVGPDGNLWFTELTGNRIGRITTAGVVTEFTVGAPSSPWGITVGPDGNFWFGNEGGVTGIGRMTPAGVVTFFSAGFTGTVYCATTAPDGNIWFTEPCCARIGRLAPAAGPSPTTTALASSLNPSTFGQSVTFTATVSGSSPTGTVQFRDGATNLGSPVTASDGIATFTTSTLAVGSHPITAVYSGDANNLTSTSNTVNQAVNAVVVPTTVTPVPTLGEWGLLLTMLMLMLLGAIAIARRR